MDRKIVINIDSLVKYQIIVGDVKDVSEIEEEVISSLLKVLTIANQTLKETETENS